MAVRRVGEEDFILLSHDGSEGNGYTHRSLRWSPDSRKLAAYRVIPGTRGRSTTSSPRRRTNFSRNTPPFYAKPGDVLDKEQPVVFDVETGSQIEIDDALFPNAYTLSRLVWREDSRSLTFEYNQRGHQVFRIIEVDAASGETRAVISEEPETFFDYSGKKFRADLNDGEEIVWMSERDGWNHLYLYDGVYRRGKEPDHRRGVGGSGCGSGG